MLFLGCFGGDREQMVRAVAIRALEVLSKEMVTPLVVDLAVLGREELVAASAAGEGFD